MKKKEIFDPKPGFCVYVDLECISGPWLTLKEALVWANQFMNDQKDKPHIQIRCEMIVYNDFGHRR